MPSRAHYKRSCPPSLALFRTLLCVVELSHSRCSFSPDTSSIPSLALFRTICRPDACRLLPVVWLCFTRCRGESRRTWSCRRVLRQRLGRRRRKMLRLYRKNGRRLEPTLALFCAVGPTRSDAVSRFVVCPYGRTTNAPARLRWLCFARQSVKLEVRSSKSGNSTSGPSCLGCH